MEYVIYEVKDMVGVITINREKALNALNSQVLEELNEAFDSSMGTQRSAMGD